MKIAIYSCHGFEKKYIKDANTKKHELVWIEDTLDSDSVNNAKGCKIISIFYTDKTEKKILIKLGDLGVGLIATRSADHKIYL